MAIIRVPLSSRKYPGRYALIDERDLPLIEKHRWHIVKSPYSFYAATHVPNGDGTFAVVGMHRIILGAKKGQFVDHRDHDGLNNTRSNIRLCTPQENSRNQRSRPGAELPYKGVTRRKDRKKISYRATIGVDGRRLHIGYFSTPEEAARAYDRAAIEYHGEFAYLNFPDEHDQRSGRSALAARGIA